jgi:hypothetical protein
VLKARRVEEGAEVEACVVGQSSTLLHEYPRLSSGE